MTDIKEFHAHVYFDETTLTKAERLCETLRDLFDIQMGRVHQKPVGPHPRWSCQMTVPSEKIGAVITWLSINRDGLTQFIHPCSGDDLKDHTDHAIWMGEMLELDLSIF